MIELLQRLAHDQAANGDILAPRAAHLLEWSRITDQIARHCRNRRAMDAIISRRPFISSEAIRFQHALSDELRPTGQTGNWPPLMDLSDGLDLLEMAEPVRYEGPDLVHLASVAEHLDALRQHFLASRIACPLWGDAAVQMSTFTGVSGAIRRALDLDGNIVDGASPLLARLRRAVSGQERAVRHEMSQVMGSAKAKGWTTGSEVTMRGDRFCLPLRSGESTRIAGIVHDRSSTGATLFVEPASVVRLSNELTETRLDIAAEEARIIFELNRAVERASEPMREAAAVMLLLDEVRAHLLWSMQVRASRPQLESGASVRISGGRHPLLMEALGEGDLKLGAARVVPLDLEIPSEGKALVISGPNAGGKSVALKTVGIFCLLAQCGWDVPGREDTRLPLISRLMVDLGDDQSIAEALSSFSAHLGQLAGFLNHAGPDTLVLCDEIGSGTDPQEGTALAFAVLERLIAQGAQVLASTHFGLLKAAVHEHPQMVNAAMDYNEKDLLPLYTFRVGDPGTSHAFDIAARMGLPADLLDRARKMAGEERVQIEQLLSDLDRRAGELADQQNELHLALEKEKVLGRDLEDRLKGLKKERKKVLEDARQEGDKLMREGRRAIEAAVREIKSEQAGKRVVKAARDRLDGVGEKIRRRLENDTTGSEAHQSIEVKEGMRIRIPHLGLIGRVNEVRGGRITALAEGLRLTLGREAVVPLTEDGLEIATAGSAAMDQDARSEEETVTAGGNWSWQGDVPSASHELDLRGETGAEGWERLDRMIDRAIPAGLDVVSVIHGFGTGRLRDYLYEKLKNDPRIASFGEAGRGRGGAGATRIVLKG
jgi:DNA mismatch repair protein MutS2